MIITNEKSCNKDPIITCYAKSKPPLLHNCYLFLCHHYSSIITHYYQFQSPKLADDLSHYLSCARRAAQHWPAGRCGTVAAAILLELGLYDRAFGWQWAVIGFSTRSATALSRAIPIMMAGTALLTDCFRATILLSDCSNKASFAVSKLLLHLRFSQWPASSPSLTNNPQKSLTQSSTDCHRAAQCTYASPEHTCLLAPPEIQLV